MANFANQNLTRDEQMQAVKVEHWIDEYAAHAPMFMRDGLSLKDYVCSRQSDCGDDAMSDTLAAALDKMQAGFGTPVGLGNDWLTSNLNA